MSVTVRCKMALQTTEVLETSVPAAGDASLLHNGYDTAVDVGAASSPPVSKCAFFEQALSDAAATIDLTALVGSNGAAVDGTGLRVQFLKFRNKAGNANVMSLAIGAANGYDGFGAGFKITLAPGAEQLVRTLDGGSDISGTNCELDLAGTGAQVAEMAIVMG